MDLISQSPIPFIMRPIEYDRLVALLTDQQFFLPVAVTTSLPGGRGFGKTTLARAVCQDPRVRRAFHEGIIWVTLGRALSPLELLNRLEQVIYELSGRRHTLENIEAAEQKLHELLHPRHMLLVIDEADDEATLKPFLHSGPGGACLLITHEDTSLPEGSRRVPVDIMMPDEAAALLLSGLLEDAPAEAAGEDAPAADAPSTDAPESTPPDALLLDMETDSADLAARDAWPGDAVQAEWDALAPEPDAADAVGPAEDAPAGPSDLDELGDLATRLGFTSFDASQGLGEGWPLEHSASDSAAAFLERHAPLPQQVEALSDLLNDWPLLLALVNGMLRAQVAASGLEAALEAASQALERQSLAPGWLIVDGQERQRALSAVLSACLETLEPAARGCFLDLTVFPAGEDVPLAALQTLWGLRPDETRTLCEQLAARNLLSLDSATGRIRLHSAVHAALRERLWTGQLATLHNRLIEAYRASAPDGWPSGPDDGYYYQHLAAHLEAAGRNDDLQALLFDYDWLARYLFCAEIPGGRSPDLFALLGDYERALSTALDQQSAELRLVQDALQMAAPVLIHDPTQLAPQLLGRLLGFDEPEIRRMIHKAQDWQGRAWLSPLASCFPPPGGDEVRALHGHDDWVTGVCLLADGQRAVSGSLDGSLRVWDLANGQALRVIPAHEGGVSAVQVTPDGRRVVSAGWDGYVRVWDLSSGEELHAFHAHLEPVGALLLTHDGEQVVTGADDRLIRIWDLRTGEMQMELIGHSDLVRALALTPDGRTLVSGSWDYTLRLWDLETGKLLHILTGHDGWVRSVAVSPDGYYALSGAWDRTVRVWDLWTGETVRMASGFRAPIFSLAVTPDSRLILAGGGDGSISLWDYETMEARHALRGHLGGVNDLALTQAGRFMVSGSDDRSLRVWDLVAVQGSALAPSHDGPVYALATLPDGQHTLSGSWDGTLKVWEPAAGKEIRTLSGHEGGVLAMAVTADGQLAISGSRDCSLRLWSLADGRQLRALSGHEHPITAVAMTPDGRVAVSGDDGGVLRAWDLESGLCLAEFRGEGAIWACALSADGATIAASESGGKMYFLEIKR